MASLTTTLVISLAQSVNPHDLDNPESVAPDAHPAHSDKPSLEPTEKNQPLPHNLQIPSKHDLTLGVHYWDPGRDEDNYWQDGATARPPKFPLFR